jgi:hypothetical protein
VLVAAFFAAVTSTTEEPRRMVGDPLPKWVVIGAGVLLLVAIVVAGLVAQRRSATSASG